MSIWSDCLEIFEMDSSIGKTVFNIILSNMKEVHYIENKFLLLSCRDDYSLSLVKKNDKNIKDTITKVVSMVCGTNINVEFVLENDNKSIDTIVFASDLATTKENKENSKNESYYYDINSNIARNFSFDNFITGETNRFAKANAMQVAENPGYADNNPFYLWGGSGLGKTHLLYAIAKKIKENNPNLNILYTECMSFVDEYVVSSKNNNYDKFRDKYDNADVLLIDDIQYLIGKIGCQNEFFTTFNRLIKAGKQIVISSDKSPNFMPELDERLTSRFSQGITMDIQPPNYETRKAIILSKLEADNIKIDNDFIDFFCENFTTNIRRLLGAYTTFKSYISMSGEDITFETFKTIMNPLVTPNEEDKLSPDFIANKVCNYFSTNYYKVTIDKLKSNSRVTEVIKPRKVCIYFFIELLHMTYNEIGIYFGGKKHSTILHSYDAIKKELEENKTDIVDIVNNISKEFK